jgi:hypothetical protein
MTVSAGLSLTFGGIACAAIVLAGCSRRHEGHWYGWRLEEAKAVGPAAIRECDSNGDGVISGEELDRHPGLKAAVDRLDPSGKGRITAAMVSERVTGWVKSRLAGMTFACTVTHNGKPLEGAVVKLVPEGFLGPNMQTASGKTDKNGYVAPSVPTMDPRDPPGVGPGFYRVEITKPGEKIPSKYNTETTLGEEVSPDGSAPMRAAKFDLSY